MNAKGSVFKCFSCSLYCSQPTLLAYYQFYISVQPLPERDVLALEILSYIGYGITFVCLIAVIVIFVSFKPLWGLRTYIHIHLCVNLLIALFITVFGMDKEKPYEKVCLIPCESAYNCCLVLKCHHFYDMCID